MLNFKIQFVGKFNNTGNYPQENKTLTLNKQQNIITTIQWNQKLLKLCLLTFTFRIYSIWFDDTNVIGRTYLIFLTFLATEDYLINFNL